MTDFFEGLEDLFESDIKIDPEFESLIPPLIEEDKTQLEESLIKDGCRDALVVWNGTLVDGHNRYRICQEHGIPFKTTEMNFQDRNECMLWMIKNQFGRRNLTKADRILLAQKQKPLLEKAAKEAQKEAGKTCGRGMTEEIAFVKSDNSYSETKKQKLGPQTTEEFEELIDVEDEPEVKQEKKPVHVRDEIAKLAGVSSGTVAKFEQIQQKKPELIEDIRSRKTSIDNAYKTVKAEEKKQKQEAAIQEQIERPKTTNHIDIYNPEKKYRVIYADPPWSYNDKQNTELLGGAEKHYPTMPLEDICALPIPAEDNAVLFLWVTSPMLEDCFKVINAWKFTYKSSFVWDKVKHNMGHYNSVRHEFLLICTKGNCVPDVAKLYDSVQSIERTDHSRKPKEFRDIIDTLYPSGNRLELFAREAPDGWDVWGNMA